MFDNLEILIGQNCCGVSECLLCNDMNPQSYKLKEYLDKIINLVNNNAEILLAIVGKDPYPENSIGVPFMKDNMSTEGVCKSGFPILRALGIQKFPSIERDTKILYNLLAKNGIVFLNVSYKFLGTSGRLKKKDSITCLKCAHSINKLILEKTKNIILCGLAQKGIRWGASCSSKQNICEKFPNSKIYKPFLPSATQRNDGKWRNYWGRQGILAELLDNGSSGFVHSAVNCVNDEYFRIRT